MFGSYDSEPYEKDCLSQYENLLHHFVHQNSRSKGLTFWAECDSIKKDVFNKVGGFNSKKYKQSSVEDIELGYRLKKNRYDILLDKDIQVKYLKGWNFRTWLSTEIFNRAIPWSKLIVETGIMPIDLNLKISDRFSAVVSWAILLLIAILCYSVLTGEVLIFSKTAVLILFIFCIFAFIFFNKKFYYFLLKKRGLKFSIYISPYHFLYYLYSSSLFALIYTKYKLKSIAKVFL